MGEGGCLADSDILFKVSDLSKIRAILAKIWTKTRQGSMATGTFLEVSSKMHPMYVLPQAVHHRLHMNDSLCLNACSDVSKCQMSISTLMTLDF